MRKVTESRGNSRFGSVVYKTQEGLEAPLLGDKAAAGRGDSDSDLFYGKDVERAAGEVGCAGEAGLAKRIRGEEEYRRIEHRGNSGFIDSVFNGINVLAGIGILSTPYATAQAGWLGLLVLLFFAAACCYTAILLRRCMDFQPQQSSPSSASAFPSDSSLRSFADDPAAPPPASPAPHSAASARASARIVRAPRPIRSYPDIGEAAFGRAGRWLTAFLLYFELFAVTVELLILEGDNLAHLFPSGDICLLPGSLVGKGSSGGVESGGVWFLEGIARGVVGGGGGEGQREGLFGAAAALSSAVVRGIEPALEAISLATGAGNLCLEPKQFYVILSALLVLPTVWLRDLTHGWAVEGRGEVRVGGGGGGDGVVPGWPAGCCFWDVLCYQRNYGRVVMDECQGLGYKLGWREVVGVMGLFLVGLLAAASGPPADEKPPRHLHPDLTPGLDSAPAKPAGPRLGGREP
ncbi:unnamed protein product [Closterium sp. Naga37s-1]|nr:unnamed protein product [Closterium sp. Naga37s-1]